MIIYIPFPNKIKDRSSSELRHPDLVQALNTPDGGCVLVYDTKVRLNSGRSLLWIDINGMMYAGYFNIGDLARKFEET